MVGAELASKFMSTFSGMSQAYGTYDMSRPRIREADGKREGTAYTKRNPEWSELWSDHLAGKLGLGVIPIREDNLCVFGAIDIDVYEGIDHGEIARQLNRLNVPLAVCRSKSGGAHIYCFAVVAVEASKMQNKLREIAALLGYGTSEIFPKQTKILVENGDVGQWINMPYFGGMRGMRYCVASDGNALSPEQFIEYATSVRQTPEWFEKAIVVIESFPDGPPCLQILSTLGYPKGTRNDGLYNIGVYLKKSDSDNWENELDAMNHKFMVPPLSLPEVQGVAKSLKRKEYNYTCTKQPICQHCNASLCRTRKHGVGGGQGRFPSLGGLTKLNTRPPIWFWTVDGVRMELNTSELQDQRAFQRKCMDFLNQMPPVPTHPVWQAAVQHAMDSVTVVEAPEDATPEGQFWNFVEKFCTGRAQALDREEIVLGRPYTDSGKTYFRISDLMSFLQTQKFNDFKVNRIASILKEHGAQHHQANFKGRNVNFWSIPAFCTQSRPFDVPPELTEGDKF